MRVCPVCRLEYHDARATCVVDGAALEEHADPRIGTLIAGRYLVESVLGEGGMAVVYRARHTLVDRPVAVKILHARLGRDEQLRERFRREARSAAAIAHENVVTIYDSGETDDGLPYIVMELLDGESLRELLARGPLPLETVAALGLQMARGLARAHDLGVVHRDLKPENIFIVQSESGEPLLKLVDFGIARSRGETHLTLAGEVVGTPQYIAPERIKGKDAGAASDLYSLGIVLFEMLAGRLPYDEHDVGGLLIAHLEATPHAVSEFVDDCPPLLDATISALLEKSPERRPVDAHRIVRVLETLSGSEETSRPRESILPRSSRTALPAVTLERWERRSLVFEQMLRRAYPDTTPPSDALDALDQIREVLSRISALRAKGLSRQRELDSLEASDLAARDQLGHAVQVLGEDLSHAREATRILVERLATKQREVADLDFQLSALREKLAAQVQTTDDARETVDTDLEAKGAEVARLEQSLLGVATRFCEPLRGRAEVEDLFAELEET